VILGGYDKNLDYEPLCEPLFEHARAVVLTGQNGEKIYRSMCDHGLPETLNVIKEPDFEKAVFKAAAAAKEGDVVILSPAAASFDRFRNFEERGKLFKKLVNSL
jgi:UDP-N-acetylmuramoylalanine--D-glutamate ligase